VKNMQLAEMSKDNQYEPDAGPKFMIMSSLSKYKLGTEGSGADGR